MNTIGRAKVGHLVHLYIFSSSCSRSAHYGNYSENTDGDIDADTYILVDDVSSFLWGNSYFFKLLLEMRSPSKHHFGDHLRSHLLLDSPFPFPRLQVHRYGKTLVNEHLNGR